MLHKWFAVRSCRSLDSKHHRLELEALEDRVSPALIVGGAPAGPYVAGGSLGAVPATAIFIPESSPLFEAYGSDYPTSFRGYDYSSSAYTVSVLGTDPSASLSPSTVGAAVATGGISSGPAAPSVNPLQLLGQMEQLVGTLSAMTVAQTHNPSQVFNLAVDEYLAAVDTFALAHTQGTGINTSAVQSDLTARQTAIQNNPVNHTPIGQMLGNAVHNTALYMFALNQGAGT